MQNFDSPYVTIVTGTWNRLSHLKSMISSARLSIGIGLPYSIIVVDGGSTDGTQAWCKTQHDIILIEQGKLLGACKAFNAGFAAVHKDCKYVVIGNDDIEFLDESLMTSVAFMDDHKEVGIGCFYQNRDGIDWHVSRMAAVHNGKQSNAYYGQVCIVPKWLGDKVGWWGTEYTTYAGDNELSCAVLELGYDVVPMPCCAINDITVADQLRVINSTLPGTSEHGHVDSLKWVNKWTRKGLLGPVIPAKKMIRSDDTPKRLLYAPIYEPGFPIQKLSKRGLRDALQKHYLVTEVDYVQDPWYIFDVASAWKPDIILTQFHGSGPIVNSKFVKELRHEHLKAVFCCWNGDYFPENFLDKRYVEMMKYYDICGFVTDDVKAVYEKAGINWKYWQIGYEVSHVPTNKPVAKHDVVFLGNGHYSFRVDLGRVLRSFKQFNVGLYGSWPTAFKANGSNLYDYDAGIKLYSNAKLTIADSRPDASGFASNRVYQAMAAGCFVLQQWFNNMTPLTGFEDGKHLIVYKETKELYNLIPLWLSPERELERKHIAKQGQDYVIKHCSFDARVEELNRWIDAIK